MKISYLILACLCLSPLINSSAKAEDNLLRNGNFEKGGGETIADWDFQTSHLPNDPADREHVVWESLKEASGNRCLRVASTAPIEKLMVLWTQENKLSPGSYHLKFRAKGSLKKQEGEWGAPDAGVYFLDEKRKWISFVPVPGLAFTNDWKEYQLDFTAPENATVIGVRFGLNCRGGIAEILVDDAVLTKNAQ